MKFIVGEKGKSQLHELCKMALEECDEVWAAVAYVSDEKYLIKPCYEKKIPLKLWARYDYSIPVKISILEWFLGKSPLSICKLIPDIFHPKIIWWKSFGVYIGSANLTDSAWYRNYEAGIFLTEDEIEENELKDDIDNYFDEIDSSSEILSKEIVDELKVYDSDPFFTEQESFRKRFNKLRRIPKIESISNVNRKERNEKKYELFLSEWSNTLQYIRDISKRLKENGNCPVWVKPDVSEGVLVDQFLHAYYYNLVIKSNKSYHKELYEEHKKNPDNALSEAIDWWSKLDSAPDNEDTMMYEWAPFIREHLSKVVITNITEDDFIQVLVKVHAFRNYANRADYKTLGLDQKLPTMNTKERSEFLSKRLYKLRNDNGRSLVDNLTYLLYSDDRDITYRLFQLWTNPEYKIRHVGLSTYGEIIGWALPDQYPPRNDRTNKALKSLGYDVKIYSE